jgi:L-iditol 2-dehydrogenase
MKAVVRYSTKAMDARLVDVPEPIAGPGQLKLKVEYGGICSSDARVLTREQPPSPRFRPPVVVGHEGVGRVVAIGAGVTGFAVGDLVASETTFTNCGVCEFCHQGETGLCRDRTSLGWSANGHWADFIVVNARFSHKLAPHVSAKGAAVLEPFTCGVKGVTQRARINAGDWVVVWGPGPIGLGAMQAAKVAGGRVLMVGTEHSRPRLEVARKLGAVRTLVSGVDDVAAEVKALTGGYGAHVCIQAVGSQASYREAISCLRRLGQVLILAGAHDRPLEVSGSDMMTTQASIIGAEGTNPVSWDLAVDMLNGGLVDLDSLVSHVFPLADWQAGVAQTASHEGLKVLLQP